MASETVFALLQPGRVLDPRYRELAILRTAIVGDCKFEYSQHLKVARTVGLPEEKIRAINGWTTSDTFEAAERALMAAVDELLSRNLVEDATFAALKRHFNDAQLVELLFVVCTYRMHGLFIRALQLEYDTDTTARMQEVPAPAAQS
jgi:alkylhydroperoxidase family enzyme